MTFSPKVWGDALRRLQNEIPGFAFDAWIAPLAVKITPERLALGCPTSFHRDRVRLHHLETIAQCWRSASGAADTEIPPLEIELLSRDEFAAVAGQCIEPEVIEAAIAQGQRAMRRVEPLPQAHVVNGPPAASPVASRGAISDVAAPGTAPRGLAPELKAGSAPSQFQSPKSVRGVRNDAAAPSGSRIADRREPGAIHRATPRSAPTGPAGPSFFAAAPGSEQSPTDFGLDGKEARRDLPFSFDSFIVGPCNALAREAALALARRRQQSLNLLYLGGASGMGKTHLARATADEARLQTIDPLGSAARFPASPRLRTARDPRSNARVIYTSAERFTSDFVSAMRNGRNEEWTKRYRGPIDLLVVEDIHFLVGRTKTQQELYHTVEHVLDSGGRVLLTGDRAPRDLVGLDERMRALVGRGFVAELDRPDALVRRHILRAKAAAGGVHLPAECLDLLVDASDGSVRDLEGVLIQVVTTASLLGRPIDLGLSREAVQLKSGAGSTLAPRKLEVTEVVRIVAAFFGTRPEALASRSRRRDVLVPRQLAMYLAHRHTEASLTEIGRGLGRDHPSVRNAITRIERQILENAPVRYQVEALSERIDRSLDNRDSDRND